MALKLRKQIFSMVHLLHESMWTCRRLLQRSVDTELNSELSAGCFVLTQEESYTKQGWYVILPGWGGDAALREVEPCRNTPAFFCDFPFNLKSYMFIFKQIGLVQMIAHCIQSYLCHVFVLAIVCVAVVFVVIVNGWTILKNLEGRNHDKMKEVGQLPII